MASIFTKIVKGEIPCHKIAETEDYLAFLDIMPVTEGHTLVIPKQEIDYFFDLEDDLLSGLSLFSKKVAKAIEACIPCERIGMAVVGLEVPHAHVHLIPIRSISDLSFEKRRLKISPNELGKVAEEIRKQFEQLSIT